MSFRKRFLIYDLGLLGSPPLAALRDDKKAFTTYLFDLAAPDFIGMHGGWVGAYSYLQRDARFIERYIFVPGAAKIGFWTPWGVGARDGIWFRSDMASSSEKPERRFFDDLQKRLDPKRIAAELSNCRNRYGRFACVKASSIIGGICNVSVACSGHCSLS